MSIAIGHNSRSGVCPTCGHEVKSPRSLEQHRRFFAVIKEAFKHWPETHPRQFPNEEYLRKWLTMRAGWREPTATGYFIGAVTAEDARAIGEATIRGTAKAFSTIVVHNGEVIVWNPTSIRFDKLGHLDFCRLNNDVDQALAEEIGFTGDELLAEKMQAAA